MQLTHSLKLTSIFLLLTCLPAQSQKVFQSFLFDKISKQPIPFATIKVLHTPLGAYTDKEGFFSIDILPSDTLQITSVGFMTKKTPAFTNDTIFLDPIVKELTPVTVSRKKVTSIETLGIKAKIDFKWGPSGYGEEFAQKISLSLKDNEYCQIKKVILSVNRFSTENHVQIHIYSADKTTGLPDKELLTKMHVITRENYKKGKIIVNLQEEDIYTDEKLIFISFEWLGFGRYNKHTSSTLINMTNQLNDTITYSRTFVYPDYNWFPAPAINGKVTNTIFTVEVARFK